MKFTFSALGLGLLAFSVSASTAFAGGGDKFAEMDKDGDKQITEAEHEAAAKDKFAKADADKDGMLKKGELTGYMMDEKGKSAAKAENKANMKMAKADSDGDGAITEVEMINHSKTWFTELDSDKNKTVSMEEMDRGHSMMHKMKK